MLFWQQNFYLNGEHLQVPTDLIDCMQLLADQRYIEKGSIPTAQLEPIASLLLPLYLAGYFILEQDF
jgi:hypothetical protein